MPYFYSAKNNAFYPLELKPLYKDWPDDCMAVDDAIYKEFSGSPNNDRIRIAGDNGLPAWQQIDKSEAITYRKKRLLFVAAEAIAPLQDAVDLNMATSEEINLLSEWKMYRVLLNRVNTDNPEWPESPVTDIN